MFHDLIRVFRRARRWCRPRSQPGFEPLERRILLASAAAIDGEVLVALGLYTEFAGATTASFGLELSTVPGEANALAAARVQTPMGRVHEVLRDDQDPEDWDLDFDAPSFTELQTRFGITDGTYRLTLDFADRTRLVTDLVLGQLDGQPFAQPTQSPVFAQPLAGQAAFATPLTVEWQPVIDPAVNLIHLGGEPLGGGEDWVDQFLDRGSTSFGPVTLAADRMYEANLALVNGATGRLTPEGIAYTAARYLSRGIVFGNDPGLRDIIVNSTADRPDLDPGDGVVDTGIPGEVTLRAAINEANALPHGGQWRTIHVAPGTYTLGIAGRDEDGGLTGDLDVANGVIIIQGAGAQYTVIDGGGLDRVFDVHSGVLAVDALTIRNGDPGPADQGGGIRVSGTGSLHAEEVEITGNEGGGIYLGPRAGGWFSFDIVDSTIAGNRGSGFTQAEPGAAVVHTVIQNTTISGNSAATGAGLLLLGGTTTIQNSTIAANTAADGSHGIRMDGQASATIQSSILFNGSGDITGTVTSAGHNVIGDAAGATIAGDPGQDRLDVDPRLGPLADHGGRTRTHSLLPASPALDWGSIPAVLADFSNLKFDQRGEGYPRVIGTAIDSGAFEYDGTAAPLLTLDIDGNGAADALTDGVLLVRFLFGFRGSALTLNAVGNGAARATAQGVADYLDQARNQFLDIDGNGAADALTDGILAVRYLFGFRGPTLAANALGTGSTRTDPAALTAFLDGVMPPALAASAASPAASANLMLALSHWHAGSDRLRPVFLDALVSPDALRSDVVAAWTANAGSPAGGTLLQ